MKSYSLLKDYQVRKNNFYFSTPEYEILVENICDKIPFNQATEIPDIITEMKAKNQLSGKLVVGAIPFDVKEGGYLYLADAWKRKDIPFKNRNDSISTQEEKNPIYSKKFVPLPESYMDMVERGVEFINSGLLNKLVLSRGVELKFEKDLNIEQILQRIYQGNSDGYTYAMKLNTEETLIGASPEMLVSKRGSFIYSNPLAGSRPRGKTENEDKALAQELKNSKKDYKEHKIVVGSIVEKVSPICKNIEVSKEPDLIHTKQLWHLSSIIKGELMDENQTVFDAALAIHPTPAVCGAPQNEAYKKIFELEERSRGLFTGIVGWCDEEGDGDWAIAIRGAEIRENMMLIQSGAGIVCDSIPEEEMKETGVKFRTMLNGINLIEV